MGSALSACVGGVSGVLTMLAFGWPDWRACLFMVGLFVLPVWLLVLLPLYVLLPRQSCLWRPFVCAAFGAGSGAILLTIFFVVSPDAPLAIIWIFLPIALLVGGITCLFGAATADYFHGTRTV